MNIYQQQILDHYHNPRNFGQPAEYDLAHAVENLSCGDAVTMYLQTSEDGQITAAYFDGEGCAISIAAASLLTEYLPGKEISQIKDLSDQVMNEILGIQLTLSRQRCATLALEAVKEATMSYEKQE